MKERKLANPEELILLYQEELGIKRRRQLVCVLLFLHTS
jgi:hypothetical protein